MPFDIKFLVNKQFLMRQLKITKKITNRESESLEKYLQEISRIDLLTPEEEVELAKRIRENKDPEAVERLAKANLRFVVSVAKQYQHAGFSLNDLINEGNIGLTRAAWKFDETKGFKFISYAVWWIRQAITQALAENSRIVRLPLNKVGNISKINKAFSELEQRYEREPTMEELEDAMVGLGLEEIKLTMSVSLKSVSLNATVDESNPDASELGELVADNSPPPDREVDYTESLSAEVENVLSVLTEREKIVLKMFFGIGFSRSYYFDEIADSIGGVTKERVRQIKDNAITRLRIRGRSDLLKKFLAQ